jgi:hypothetical protein
MIRAVGFALTKAGWQVDAFYGEAGMGERIGFYFQFWRDCAIDAWRGSWGTANALGAIFGGAILTGLSRLLRLGMDAPASVQGSIAFTFVIAVLSAITVWVAIYIVRLAGAPARLYERMQRKFVSMSNTAKGLEENIKSKIKVSFHRGEEGIVRSPLRDRYVFGGPEILATYVRVRIEAVSKTTIAGCKAFLTKIEKESPFGDKTSNIQLPQSINLRNGLTFDVYPDVLSTVDFLICSAYNNKLRVPESDWPLSLQHLFDDTGTYHFTITARAVG